jgi:hypothetical protein
MTINKSKKAGGVKSVSALLIYKGVRDNICRRVDARTVISNKHVFTGWAGRNNAWKPADLKLQHITSNKIGETITGAQP